MRNKFLSKFLEEYFWIVGLSLVVSGIILIFNDALGILISGLIFVVLASILRGYREGNKNNYFGEIVSEKTQKTIEYILKK